jgi:catechol 2,3-dioxygenase-like lactoylglutathione lyase family enzyme
MIFGSHVIVYSKDATADRDFFRDVLGFSSVDAGNGWLIFALPPAEIAVHPTEGEVSADLYFMCDDLQAEMQALAAKDVTCSQVEEARWGSVTKVSLPGGAEVGLYQPKHPSQLCRSNPSAEQSAVASAPDLPDGGSGRALSVCS